ncbi:MAG: DUF3793 family protein [Lachnospiraceae bacterium]|nr:DUF3793 family protein [Lachnospiraceae bacterium]
MSEELIIEHCSPTLAGIKTGNMFSVKNTEKTKLYKELRELNNIFRDKGLRLILLKSTNEHSIVYLYRPDQLKNDLKDPKALKILKKRGYKHKSPECCIVELVDRLKSNEGFPHEIGLFLGYPPSDVEGFMKHPCSGVKCSGCWKAYSDPDAAERTFNRYRKCTEFYLRMNRKGRSLSDLTVGGKSNS